MSTDAQLNLVNTFLDEEVIPVLEQFHTGRFNDPKRKRSAALSALALHLETGLSHEECCKAVVDGFDDEGIDAVLSNTITKKVYLVQSKLVEHGRKSIEKGEVLKFLNGVELILEQNEDLLKKFQTAGINITDALDSTDYEFVLVLISTGSELQSKSEAPLSKFLQDQNSSEEWVLFEEYNLENLSEAIASLKTEAHINIELSLENFGEITQPNKMVYGLAEVNELGEIHKLFGQKLFYKNIRSFLGKGDVNDDIQNTLKKNKDQFVYLNNGITILCEKISKKRAFGSKTLAGNFECKGVRVINGAQTLGSIGHIVASEELNLTDVKVFVRLVESGSAEDVFSQRITVASNTQNRIEKIDFASMDKHQIRLEKEVLKNLSTTYHRMRGGKTVSGITMDEAAEALSCFEEDINISTYHKRERSKIWDNLESEPYTIVFNSGTSCFKVFNVCTALKNLRKKLREKEKFSSRENTYAKVCDTFLLHMLFIVMPQKIKSEILQYNCSQSINEFLDSKFDELYGLAWRKIKGETSQLSRLFITPNKVAKLKMDVLKDLNKK